MVSLAALWLPILLAAVAVFVVSSIIHMATPMHAGDYQKVPGEDTVLAALRGQSVPPGQYCFPRPASMKDMCTPEMQQRFQQGPVGTLIVRPSGPPAMGKSLGAWFAYSLLIGVFVAYLGTLSLARGAEFAKVFQVTGTAAILGYALSSLPESIWKGVSWGTTFKFVVDGVLYGLATGAVFAAMWPAATTA